MFDWLKPKKQEPEVKLVAQPLEVNTKSSAHLERTLTRVDNLCRSLEKTTLSDDVRTRQKEELNRKVGVLLTWKNKIEEVLKHAQRNS